MSTIRDVAALAGVSIATVSRVLNNDTKYTMTAETRETVWKAATALNYQIPVKRKKIRPVQSNPSTKKTIGCILNSSSGKFNDPYSMAILSVFDQRTQELGLEIVFVLNSEELENPDMLARLLTNPPEALLLMSTLPESIFNKLYQVIPNIIGVDTEHSQIDNITYDHYEAGVMAVWHLHSMGYDDIGFIAGHKDDLSSSRIYRGYVAGLNILDLPFRRDNVIFSECNEEHLTRQIVEAATAGRLPRAIFASNDLVAVTTLRALYQCQVRVPEDVALMGIGNLELDNMK